MSIINKMVWLAMATLVMVEMSGVMVFLQNSIANLF